MQIVAALTPRVHTLVRIYKALHEHKKSWTNLKGISNEVFWLAESTRFEAIELVELLKESPTITSIIGSAGNSDGIESALREFAEYVSANSDDPIERYSYFHFGRVLVESKYAIKAISETSARIKDQSVSGIPPDLMEVFESTKPKIY